VLLAADDPRAVEQAADRLMRGELVAFPTETVYGLGARADDDAAVAHIYAAKGRPSDHPLIVHVADAKHAQVFAAQWPPVAQRLAAAFWPGPLTLIVPRRNGIGGAAAGGQDSIGLRCPQHPVAQALLLACGGPCEVGIESAIVDCSRIDSAGPVLLRPGALTREALAAAAGMPIGEPDAHAPRASGTLEAHYAPRATLRLMPGASLADALAIWADARAAAARPSERAKPTLAVYSRTVRLPRQAADLGLVARQMPASARAAAFELFAVLREFDAQGVGLIWVEQPPPGSEWDGVRDRLRRAAA
jgi:L-threonylcarbamoyladenylate synthase